MKRKVLIVSPHFPPSSAPDHQRVRMALPNFAEIGWKPTVLAVHPDCVEGVREPYLRLTVPDDVPVILVRAWPPRWLRPLGVSSLAYRAYRHLRQAGAALLRDEKFDLVFFSTTLFPLMALGPRWQSKFRVPYVLDFQDPWLSDYYDEHPERRPPGGRLKYEVSRWLARRLEPAAVRGARHVVCVSPAYGPMLTRRYPDVTAERFTTLPFGAAEADFESLARLSVAQSLFDPRDGRMHWVYIGRGGDDMGFGVRAFCAALRRFLEMQPELRARLRVHFAGTDYAPRERARKTVEPIARAFGVGDVVSEQTERLPYFEVLRCLGDADALLLLGSDDKRYTASKLYPYVLARKPLLAISHAASSITEILRQTAAGTVVAFDDNYDFEAVSDAVYKHWFLHWPPAPPETSWDAFAQYTARSMTKKLCAVFDHAVASDGP